MTWLDDESAFHYILMRPSSWPLFGFSYGGAGYCWYYLPFSFSLSPWRYHTLSEATAAYHHPKGIPPIVH